MKPLLPSEARNIYRHSMRDDIIIMAYNELIHECIDKGTPHEATFTQGQLIGRIHDHGLPLPHRHVIASHYLNQAQLFEDVGWTVSAQPGFYETINSHLTITFIEPT